MTGDPSDDLTLHQLCRMVACWRIEADHGIPWTVDEAAEACDVERTQAGRFIRAMQRRGLLALVRGQGRAYRYEVTIAWMAIAERLQAENRLPGRCCVCGDRSVSFPFLRRWFCADCLMIVTCGRHGTLCGQIVFPAVEGGEGRDTDDDDM